MAKKQAANGKFSKPSVYFSQVCNQVLRDSSLSLRAKGLYSLIVSYITLPDFVLYKGYLMAQCTEGRCAFDSAWKELVSAGYLKHARVRQQDGTFAYEYSLLSFDKKESTSKTQRPSLSFNKKESETKKNNLITDENANNHSNPLPIYKKEGKTKKNNLPTAENVNSTEKYTHPDIKESTSKTQRPLLSFDKKESTPKTPKPSLSFNKKESETKKNNLPTDENANSTEKYTHPDKKESKTKKNNLSVTESVNNHSNPLPINKRESKTSSGSFSTANNPVLENHTPVYYIYNKTLNNNTKSVSDNDQQREMLKEQIEYDYFQSQQVYSGFSMVVVDCILDLLEEISINTAAGLPTGRLSISAGENLLSCVDSCTVNEFLTHMTTSAPKNIRYPIPYWRAAFINFVTETALSVAAIG